MDANFAFVPIDGQLELDQHITGFYVDANVAIGPINWQLEWDQGVTDCYVDTNFAISPFVWILELDPASLIFKGMPTLPLDQSTGN